MNRLKINNIQQILIGCSFFVVPLMGVQSEVYNLRISQTTKRSVFEKDYEDPWLLTGTAVGQFRKRYDGAKNSVVAGMATLSYTEPSYYVRADFAGGRVASEVEGVTFSRNQTDDLLITAGLSREFGNTIHLSGSGLFGIPLHKDTSLDHVQFGYAHFGLGFQGDGSFIVSTDRNHSIRAAFRVIHFFKRTVEVVIADLPTLYRYNFGNLVDLFVAYHFHTHRQRLEIGYDLTILSGSSIYPYLAEITQHTNYVRNDFYVSFKHRFMLRHLHSALTFAVNYGFDMHSNSYKFKRIFTTWASWEINF